MKKSNQNFTVGNLSKQLFYFTLPLFFANLLQAFYQLADMIIIGRFTGSAGVAAISNASILCFIINSIGTGLSIGGTVIAAKAFGKGDTAALRKIAGSLFLIMTSLAIPISVCVWLFNQKIFLMMNVPEEAFVSASKYMNITGIGTFFIFSYHAICALLRGLGDSRRPFYFIIIATAVNILLDLVFVGAWNFGVPGAA